MKKLLFLALALLVMGLAISSCKGKSEPDKENDTIAKTMGQKVGTEIEASFKIDSQMIEQFDKDQYVKGVMTIINMDTTKKHQSYISGLKKGMEIFEKIAELEEQGISINRRVFLDAFKEVFNSKDTLDMTKLDENMLKMNNKLDSLILKNKKTPCQDKRNSTELCQDKKQAEEPMKKDEGSKKTE